MPDGRRVGVAAVHQAGDVLEADVAGLQLFVVQHADAAVAGDLVAVEGEVHFLDAVALGARAELGFRAGRAAAEQNAVAMHPSCDHSIAMSATSDVYRAGESIEDFCRACKTDRMHTVIVVDADGRPIRVACGYLPQRAQLSRRTESRRR